jgi:hypothetical protein
VPFASGFNGRPSESGCKLPWNVQLLASGGRQFVGIKTRQNAQSSHVIDIRIDPNESMQAVGEW